MKKKKVEIEDGMTPKLLSQYSSAIRKVWSWSKMRRLAVKRATDKEGWLRCEVCKEVTPKAHVDHIIPCGAINSPGFFDRLNVSSKGLQVMCRSCHYAKTKKEKNSKK